MESEVTASDEFAAPRRVGAMLADARAKSGLEITDIARDTRVPARHLAAIEADSHDNLPALPYAIGFVKSFARAVGLDAEAIGAQFRAETSKTAHVPAPQAMAPLDERRLPPRGLLTLSVIAVLVAIGVVVAWSAGAFDRSPSGDSAVAQVAAPRPAPPPVATAVAAPAGTAASDAPATVAPAPVASALAAVPATAAPATGSGQVVITASEDAWIRVSGWDAATGKVVAVKTGVLAKGERYAVPATPGLKLWTGRAGAMQISVDGRAVPALGGPVETVKNVSLNPADLRARMTAGTPGSVPGAAASAPVRAGAAR